MKVRARFLAIAAAFAGAAVAAPLQAQCSTATADACQKATDVLNYMTPQLGTALASGNPTLGQGGALGGFGHFSIDLRASAVNGDVPQTGDLSLSMTGKQNSTFTNKKKYIPAASLDAGIGLWRGFAVGVTHIGGVDAIVTMTYLPDVKNGDKTQCTGCTVSSGGDFTVDGSHEKFGYGARIGLLEESVATPGLSVAWVKRDLPTVSFTGTIDPTLTNPGGTLALEDFAVKTTAWRITAAKSFLIFGIDLGYGQDKYDASSTIEATVNGPLGGTGTQAGALSMTRTNYFVGAFVNLYICKLEGEYGQVTGGTASTYNTFSPAADASRSYFTLGLRFGN